jgi:hypothetical protein
MWAIEGLAVAADQWFGHRADPSSDIASNAAVFPFALASFVGLVALWCFLRYVAPAPHPSRERRN